MFVKAKPRRSLLFAPASRPDMLPKALASGADIVCADLEDAVAQPLKAEARRHGLAFLAGEGGGAERALRLNPLRSVEGARDLAALADRPPVGAGLVLMTKVYSADEVSILSALLDELGWRAGLVPLIETARGLEHAAAIAAASNRVALLLFGAADLAAEMGAPLTQESMLYARSRLVHAAAQAGVGVLDVPCLDFKNLDAVKAEAEAAKALGLTGKAALHPSNVAVVNAVFSPSASEAAQARRVLAAFEASPTGLAVLDGRLVEKPVARAAARIVARADAVAPQVR